MIDHARGDEPGQFHVCRLIEASNLDGGLMQLVMRCFDLLENRGQARNLLFGVFAIRPVEPLAERALVIVRLHGQFSHILVGNQGHHLIGPVQMIDLLARQILDQFILADHILGAGPQVSDTAKGDDPDQRQQNQHQPKPQCQLPSNRHVLQHRSLHFVFFLPAFSVF